MIQLTIDSKAVSVQEGTSVLEAALQNGIYIPHLCHHPDLPELGSCRLCLVDQGDGKPVPSCMLQAEEGMNIKTRSETIDARRQLAMELILAAHPAECVGCPKYGRCELQLLIQYMDATATRMHMRVKRVPGNEGNPLYEHEMLRCVLCGRCVRACKDLREVGVLRYNKAGMETYVGTLHNKLLSDADCRFCGACAEVCPTGAIRDIVNFNATEKRATLLPCVEGCPAHTEIPEYLRYAAQGDLENAAAVIREKLPFPESLGRVCSHACELHCRRGEVNAPVSIREVKRSAAETDTFAWKARAKQLPDTGKKVCVVGGGPAGITAAIYLRKQGHAVTVLEIRPKLGGQLQYGIPSYRLPREIVDKECDYAREIGVEVQCNTAVTDFAALKKDYDAVVVATGTHSGTRLPIDGSKLPGVLVCTDFLRNASEGKDTGMGERVVVLGAGNVAFDCARTAVRLGAKSVSLVCRKPLSAIKADREEIEQAQEEGVVFYDGRTFDAVAGVDKAEGMKASKIARTYTDENGKNIVEKVPDSQETIPADTVIFAVGQRSTLTADCGFELGRANSAAVKDGSSATSLEGVFACGDVVTGTKSVILAIAGARDTASEVDRYLGGDGDISESLVQHAEHKPNIGKREGFAKIARNEVRFVSADERKDSFRPVSDGLCGAACEEAGRCMQCDLRFDIHPARPWTNYQDAAQKEG